MKTRHAYLLGFPLYFAAVILVCILFLSCDEESPSENKDKPGSETVTDVDGNVYNTIKIGEQVWMAENLRVTRFQNGQYISTPIDNATWSTWPSAAQCCYNDEPIYLADYGRLYNWHAVSDARGLAPEGWHIPSDEDWKELEMYLGMSQQSADSLGPRGKPVGGLLKESGTEHWFVSNSLDTNESGFTALPGGIRWLGGDFHGMGSWVTFWTSTEKGSSSAWSRGLDANLSHIMRGDGYFKTFGLSVRCVKE